MAESRPRESENCTWFFYKSQQTDSERIKFINEFGIFTIKDKGTNEIPDWLLPNESEYGRAYAMEYYHKKLCRIASNGSVSDYKYLYEEVAESEVWDLIAIDKTLNKEQNFRKD